MPLYACEFDTPPVAGQACNAYVEIPAQPQIIPQLTVEDRDALTLFFLKVMLVGFGIVMAKRQLLRR